MKLGVSLALLFCLMAGMSYGQGGASVQGTISDATGAVLPGANVNVKHSGTGSSVELVTDERGRYLVPVLQPGEYEIQASLPGFQTVSRRGIHLTVGQNAVIDIKLDVGQVTNQVEVVADANPINLTSAAVSGLVNDKQIRDLPLNGRSFQQLALLQRESAQPWLQAMMSLAGARRRFRSMAHGPSRTIFCSMARTLIMSITRPRVPLPVCCSAWIPYSNFRF